jgi:hypothetical protein
VIACPEPRRVNRSAVCDEPLTILPPRERSCARLLIASPPKQRCPATSGRPPSRPPSTAITGFTSALDAANLTLPFSKACALLLSLCVLFPTAAFCFQPLAHSFAKYRGVWVPPKTCPLESATYRLFSWTLFATWLPHPASRVSDCRAHDLSPLESALTKSALLTPLKSALTETAGGWAPSALRATGRNAWGTMYRALTWALRAGGWR